MGFYEIGKGPQDGNRSRVAASTFAICVGAITTRLLALTIINVKRICSD